MARRADLKLLQGTLDLLVLKALEGGSLHGYGVAALVRERTGGAIEIEDGALYTSLHRLERRGWVEAEWGVSEEQPQSEILRVEACGPAPPVGGDRVVGAVRGGGVERGAMDGGVVVTGAWLRRLMRGSREEARRAVDAELAHHFESVVTELVSAGWTRPAAEAEARRRFGDEAYHRRELERITAGTARRRLWQRRWDAGVGALRSAFRSIARSPALGLAVIVTFGLGVGANATVFSIVDRLMLSPPAHIDAPDEVRRVMVERAGGPAPPGEAPRRVTGGAMTMSDFEDLLGGSQWSALGAYSDERVIRTVGDGADAQRISSKLVTASFWRVLAVRPAIGRVFTEDEDGPGAAGVAVISHALWQRMYGGGASVRGPLLRIVLARALRVTTPGILVGLAAALLLAPRIAAMLYSVSPRDPVVLGAVAIALLATTVLAAGVPAWHALRVDPNTALRAD